MSLDLVGEGGSGGVFLGRGMSRETGDILEKIQLQI